MNSVGLFPKTLPFATSNTIVNTFRHAVSLDERRAKFKANLWNRPNKDEAKLSDTDKKLEQEQVQKQQQRSKPHNEHHKQRAYELKYQKDRKLPTNVEEVE